MLKARLAAVASLPDEDREVMGLAGIHPVMDFQKGSGWTKLSLMVAFAGEIALVVGYTVLMLAQASVLPGGAQAVQTAGTAYVLLLLLALATAYSNDRVRRDLARKLAV